MISGAPYFITNMIRRRGKAISATLLRPARLSGGALTWAFVPDGVSRGGVL